MGPNTPPNSRIRLFRSCLTLFLVLANSIRLSAQMDTWFVEPEVMVGRNVVNWSRFPDSGERLFYAVGVGKMHRDTSTYWNGYYNFPGLSFTLFYSDLGSSILGKELGVIPTFTFNVSKRRDKSFYFKLGLGMSYATNPFDSLANPGNEILGSSWNWIFQLYLYRTLLLTERWHVKVGAGGVHTSNSHTTLPNFGLNSGMIALSAQYFLKPYARLDRSNWSFQPDRRRQYFIQITPGLGLHELGGTRRPLDGPTKIIPSVSLATGIIFRRHLKVKTGFVYRYYDSFRDDIVKNDLPDFRDAPIWNASHIYLLIGMEYLVGHVGLELESGITLHKPYFDHWFRSTDSDNAFLRWQNKTFPTRIGGNFYLFNTNNSPAQNLYVGLHVNANWGTADFMGYTMGYIRRLNFN